MNIHLVIKVITLHGSFKTGQWRPEPYGIFTSARFSNISQFSNYTTLEQYLHIMEDMLL